MIGMSVPKGDERHTNSDQPNDPLTSESNVEKPPRNTLFVVGSEGKGMKESIARLCTDRISIPGGDTLVDSLNLSVAVGIVLANSTLINNQKYK